MKQLVDVECEVILAHYRAAGLVLAECYEKADSNATVLSDKLDQIIKERSLIELA